MSTHQQAENNTTDQSEDMNTDGAVEAMIVEEESPPASRVSVVVPDVEEGSLLEEDEELDLETRREYERAMAEEAARLMASRLEEERLAQIAAKNLIKMQADREEEQQAALQQQRLEDSEERKRARAASLWGQETTRAADASTPRDEKQTPQLEADLAALEVDLGVSDAVPAHAPNPSARPAVPAARPSVPKLVPARPAAPGSSDSFQRGVRYQ